MTKQEDITVRELSNHCWQVEEPDHWLADFRGPNAQQYAEEHAQKLRDALPKPRFETCLRANRSEVWDRETQNFVAQPKEETQDEFPGLVQHICDWLNEQIEKGG